MQISVILSTYNEPEWLERVLWGYAVQTMKDFEVIIADDGSTEETAHRIQRLERLFAKPIRHVWHRHDGFRKTMILNQAILASSGNYLIFSDGDCIPRCNFIEQHMRLAEPGRFLSGGVVRLPHDVSRWMTNGDVISGRATSLRWLWSRGLPASRKWLLLACSSWPARVLDAVTTTRATWNGHNASGWKSDIVRVNGFDERMGYGGLDRELGARLENAGVRPKQIRHRTVCVHLHHARPYVCPHVIRQNRAIWDDTVKQRRTRTTFGIAKVRLYTPDELPAFATDSPDCTAESTPLAPPLSKAA